MMHHIQLLYNLNSSYATAYCPSMTDIQFCFIVADYLLLSKLLPVFLSR